jgi:hypothetical protein
MYTKLEVLGRTYDAPPAVMPKSRETPCIYMGG